MTVKKYGLVSWRREGEEKWKKEAIFIDEYTELDKIEEAWKKKFGTNTEIKITETKRPHLPIPSQAYSSLDAKLNIDKYGWCYLDLSAKNPSSEISTRVHFSVAVGYPIEDLGEWLINLQNRNFSKIDLDNEGDYSYFISVPVEQDTDQFEFIAIDQKTKHIFNGIFPIDTFIKSVYQALKTADETETQNKLPYIEI